jgi:hypothetical protein
LPSWSKINRRVESLFPISETDVQGNASWSSTSGRQRRYSILESFADLTIYSGPHADWVRREFRAYRKVRSIAAPFSTVVDFHASHIMGPGPLDPDAGPGDPVESCLPIKPGKRADARALQKAVASLWRASNWAANKKLLGWYGAALGDVGLEVIADEKGQKVRMRIVHPGEVVEHDTDQSLHTKNISYERDEIDPADPQKQRYCKYKKSITNDGGVVTVRTFRDGKPYQWPDTPGTEWELPWGFVPAAMIQHKSRGREWGISELSNMLGRGVELDGQESALNDQTLKAIMMPLWMNNAKPQMDRWGNPKPIKLEMSENGDDRNDFKIIYTNSEGASIEPLVYEVPLDDANERCKRAELIIARDYPELLASDPVGLAASGEARREARRKTSDKINEARIIYDAALVRIHQMAMTMGGSLGFPDYPFTLQSFDDGKTDHAIGSRTVFGEDPIEVLQQRKLEADALDTYFGSGQGTTLRWALRRLNVPQDQIDDLTAQIAAEAVQARQLKTDQPTDQPPQLAVVGQ